MRVEYPKKTKKTVSAMHIEYGDTFTYENELYIKIKHDADFSTEAYEDDLDEIVNLVKHTDFHCLAVNLYNGATLILHKEDMVEIEKSKVVVLYGNEDEED